MSKKIKIGIIGFGNMGSSCATAFNKKIQYEVLVYDSNPKKKTKAKDLCFAKDINTLIRLSEIIVLAIKPQDIEAFLTQNKDVLLKKKPLLVSIAAGIPLSWFQKRSLGIRVIRVMPNLAAKVEESFSFISKGKNAKKADLVKVKDIFSSIGKVITINEKYLDKATGVSGSGPGYIFYFMDSMYQETLKLGFTKKEAKRMIIQTFLGAVKLAKASKEEFKTLVNSVASKKGTTEAALKVFKAKKLNQIIALGINKACQRAKEISSNLANMEKK